MDENDDENNSTWTWDVICMAGLFMSGTILIIGTVVGMIVSAARGSVHQ